MAEKYKLYKVEDHTASIRAGGDLIVDVIHWHNEGDELADFANPPVWEVQAFDGSGNPLAVMGAFSDPATMHTVLPSLVQLAREMYGPRQPRHIDAFDMTAWTYTPDEPERGRVVEPVTGIAWAWQADSDDLPIETYNHGETR